MIILLFMAKVEKFDFEKSKRSCIMGRREYLFRAASEIRGVVAWSLNIYLMNALRKIHPVVFQSISFHFPLHNIWVEYNC
jgi:hypothetical protein